jgi:hypothetical protein
VIDAATKAYKSGKIGHMPGMPGRMPGMAIGPGGAAIPPPPGGYDKFRGPRPPMGGPRMGPPGMRPPPGNRTMYYIFVDRYPDAPSQRASGRVVGDQLKRAYAYGIIMGQPVMSFYLYGNIGKVGGVRPTMFAGLTLHDA